MVLRDLEYIIDPMRNVMILNKDKEIEYLGLWIDVGKRMSCEVLSIYPTTYEKKMCLCIVVKTNT